MAILRGRYGAINPNHRDGLKLAYKFPDFTNKANGSAVFSNRTGSPIPQNAGLATGTSGLQLPPAAFSAARLTIICQFIRNDFTVGVNHFLTADSYSDGNRAYQFRLEVDTLNFIGFVGNVDKSVTGAFTAAYRDIPLTVAVVHDGTTTTLLGNSLGVTSVLYSGTGVGGNLDTDPAYLGIGCGWANASSSYDTVRSTTHRYLLAWDRALTIDHAAELVANPSLAFARPRILYFPVSGGGGATTLTVQGLTQGHSLGSPSLTEHNILAVQGLGQAHTLGAPTLTQHNVLAANALSHAQSLGAPALTQHNVLAVNAIAQAHALGNVTLTQAHILTVQGIGQAHSLGAPSLTQHNALTPAPLTQAQTLGNISLTVAGSIAAADIAQGHSLGTPALTQHHVLTVAALMQAHSLDQPALSQAGTLAVQSMTQAQVLDAVALVQHHALAVQALLQGHALGSITLTASDALAIDGLTHAQILGAPSLTQHNVLAVQNMTHAQILQAVTLGGLVIGSLRGTLVAYSLLDGEVVCRALLSGSLETVH